MAEDAWAHYERYIYERLENSSIPERRALAGKSRANFAEFMDRHKITKLAGGHYCPRRLLGRRCVYGLTHGFCLCSDGTCSAYGSYWIDHHKLYLSGREAVVFVSQPYSLEEESDSRWEQARKTAETAGLRFSVLGGDRSWYLPEGTNLIEVTIWRPALVELAMAAL